MGIKQSLFNEVERKAKIRNRYNQVPHLTQTPYCTFHFGDFSVPTDAKFEPWTSNVYDLSIELGLTLLPMENYQVFP